jgi:hypothetical protein
VRILCIDHREVFPVSPRHINRMYLYSVFMRCPFKIIGQVMTYNVRQSKKLRFAI